MRLVQFIILTALGVGIYFAGVQYTKKYIVYENEETKEKCELSGSKMDKINEGTECHVWDGRQCRRGIVNSSNGTCVAQGNLIPIILIGLSLAFIISAIFSLFIN